MFVLKKREGKASKNTRKSFWYVSGRVKKQPQSEAGNQRLREPHKTRSAKRTKCSGAEERTKDTCSPKKTAEAPHLLNCPPHQLPSYNRPVRCCPPDLNAKEPLPSIFGRVREGIRGRFPWGPPYISGHGGGGGTVKTVNRKHYPWELKWIYNSQSHWWLADYI